MEADQRLLYASLPDR